jgi:hypothetical protein
VALDIPDREAILRVLEDCPEDCRNCGQRFCKSTPGVSTKGSSERQSALASSPLGDFSARGRGGKMRNDRGTAEWNGDLPVYRCRWIPRSSRAAS